MKRVNKNRLKAYLPRVETLENRWQPGSILTSALDLSALGSALDQNVGNQDNNPIHNQALNLSLGSLHNNQNGGGTVSVTPYQVTHTNATSNTSLPLSSGSSLNLGSQSQGLASAGKHLGTSASHSTQSTGTSQSTTINWHQQGGAQTSQTNVTLSANPVQATPVAAPTVHAASAQPVSLKLTTQTGGEGNHPPYTGQWASLFSNPASAGSDTAALNKVVEVGGGATATLYAIGEVTDASTGNQDIAILSTAAGSTSATFATLSSVNPGNARGLSIALDSTGNLLIGGTVIDSSGNTAGVVGSVTPDLTTLNWANAFNGPSAINGVADVGGTVYFTGYFFGMDSQNDVLLGTSDESGNVGFAFYYSFSVPTIGNAVGVDTNTGNIDVAGSYGAQPVFLQAPPDGSNMSGGYFAAPGAFNAVNVDGAGNAYYSGPFMGGSTISDLVAKVNPDGMTLSSDYSGSAWYWTFSIGGVPGNAPSYDAKIDAAGDQLQQLTFDDNSGTAGSHSQLFFEIGPTGQTSVDFGDGGVFGALDDYGYGLATDGANNIYTVGKTDSTDFATNGFQTTYSTGDPFEGWIGYFTEP